MLFCLENNVILLHRCMNKDEEYDPYGRRCVPIKKCHLFPEHCHGAGDSCVDKEGAMPCMCKPGFKRVDGICVLENKCNNTSCNGFGKCQNIEGGFECICDDKYYVQNNTCVPGILPHAPPTTTTIPPTTASTLPPTTIDPKKCDPQSTEHINLGGGSQFYCRCLDGYVPSELPTRCHRMLEYLNFLLRSKFLTVLNK